MTWAASWSPRRFAAQCGFGRATRHRLHWHSGRTIALECWIWQKDKDGIIHKDGKFSSCKFEGHKDPIQSNHSSKNYREHDMIKNVKKIHMRRMSKPEYRWLKTPGRKWPNRRNCKCWISYHRLQFHWNLGQWCRLDSSFQSEISRKNSSVVTIRFDGYVATHHSERRQ